MVGGKSVTLLIDEATASKMKAFYAFEVDEAPDNPVWGRSKENEVTITIYKKNKRGERKALFQGDKALYEARIWDQNAKLNGSEAKIGEFPIVKSEFPQIGSDEVGTGDFFGPIIVVASFLKEEDLPYIEREGITDSKKMSDEHILSLGPALIKKFDYSELSLNNEKFNEEEMKKLNMNEIKAKMHNKALLNVSKRHPGSYIYQDQFAQEHLYYEYLENEKEVLTGIVFQTKGESYYPTVALSSVIARYAFLRKMAKLDEKYGMHFPFGSGEATNLAAQEFIKKYGLKELKKVAKISFSNYKKLNPSD